MATLQQVRDQLAKLVAFRSVSADSNLELIEYVRAYLSGCGVAHVTVMKAQDGIHANLVATLPSAAGATEGGLILSGHTDVVPVEGQAWDSDPFVLTEREGKLYGRGSCDMKAFIAVVLALVPEWVRTPPRKPVQLVLTYNEETNFGGVNDLVASCSAALKKCEGCIVGEPTMLDLVIAHKGICSNYITMRGKAAHSSLQTAGYNAIEPAAQFMNFLFEMRERFAREGPFEEGYAVTHTTLCPSFVRGGNAMNTIPAACTVGFEFRNVQAHSGAGIKREIHAKLDELEKKIMSAMTSLEGDAAGAKGSWIDRKGMQDVQPFSGNDGAAVVQALRVAHGAEPKTLKVCFCTEAGEYQNLGVNTVVCGPGSIEQAHKANEFVSLEQLEKGLAVIRRVVQLMCGGGAASQL
ncbi:acetylornithine deacetylase-like protein [Leptomonas pyrrhocoris]|uniref:Acetylornithine deacetylase-like protein n=1 Tax=Leptomonas pyrrhocoris TaxID=157538 RepID=A0A0M9FP74_LEPPY|nr:acetylornithine deacetylase-like protein [Leptomonas pyrrhocoris]XP_015651627.1 acetylornithine deacetylase-like protein [Leptomonas pyrrhocoris]XP_015651628.1 acetylornithine deacetylase-like protein [Leptomonas pyrrhocoris]XP_015651629.1 acetylornithine deacetylase-like protein [Leptomonas pyrrhocoris]XP_015651630.1 acetylornithine deacetylase-like protein [Leptomonas pyrrhocoris]KPA73187.1 acetylornithine deacetylase-like protein [Leptomonas pyrrhocoris]KPA73188.1 acetylornithine deacet|eukprot:XP_015651626.1 acetylornithine deacetylase-like protein [Leptomonas pyrrhocoris]